VVYEPLWKMKEFVTWDDHSQDDGKNKNGPNHQPDMLGSMEVS
jgi:hypothetical protein